MGEARYFPRRAGFPRVGSNAAPPPRRATYMPDRPLSILLVEDHAATAGALAKMLLRQGFKVQTAGNADEALKAARSQTFDLLLTDIGLPGMSGWDLFLELKQLQPRLASIAL